MNGIKSGCCIKPGRGSVAFCIGLNLNADIRVETGGAYLSSPFT